MKGQLPPSSPSWSPITTRFYVRVFVSGCVSSRATSFPISSRTRMTQLRPRGTKVVCTVLAGHPFPSNRTSETGNTLANTQTSSLSHTRGYHGHPITVSDLALRLASSPEWIALLPIVFPSPQSFFFFQSSCDCKWRSFLLIRVVWPLEWLAKTGRFTTLRDVLYVLHF